MRVIQIPTLHIWTHTQRERERERERERGRERERTRHRGVRAEVDGLGEGHMQGADNAKVCARVCK